jgi:uncharacterized protein YjbI with pentapeptide repeats
MTDSKPPSNSEDRQDEKWQERPRVQMAIAGTIIVACLLVLGFVLDLYIAPTKPTHRKDVAQALGLIAAGGAGAYGIYFTWRNQKLARQSQEQNQKSTEAQLQNAQEELRLTRRSQITERFTQAIDQLGASNDDGSRKLEIRLGGIYALERTARDSKSDYWPVMEVLTAYVRQLAPWKFDEESAEEDTPTPERIIHIIQQRAYTEDRRPEHTPEPDIQAALTVVGRRPEYHRTGTFEDGRKIEYGRIDLHDTDLRGADLRGVHLEEADLRGVHLEEAKLGGAHLEQADLRGAHLEEAVLVKAHLERADLRKAHLEGAILAEGHLEEAVLVKAHLAEAKLGGVHLEGAELSNAHLEGAALGNARLWWATLNNAHLEGAILLNADLEGASLGGAHLEGVEDLESEQIKWATGNEETQLPEHLIDHRPAMWSKTLVDQIKILEEQRRSRSRASAYFEKFNAQFHSPWHLGDQWLLDEQ